MKAEEAIEQLWNIGLNNYRSAEKDKEALDMGIEALQKQIPKQPTIENGFVKCPACELYIRFPIMDHYNNCPECGQALKWRGDEE